MTNAPFLLVAGAWHGAAHWRNVVSRLSAEGREARALDLAGHGEGAPQPEGYAAQDMDRFAAAPSPVAATTLEEAADALIDALPASGDAPRPVVVAHSIAGAVLTLAAERAPERFGQLIYLAAYVPTDGRSAGDFGAMPEAQTGYGADLFIGDPAATGCVRVNPRGGDAYLESVRQSFYHDVEPEVFRPFADAMTPDLPVSFWITGVRPTAERWGRLPKTYIGTELDRATAPALQEIMIHAGDAIAPDNPFEVRILPSAHSPFASMPDRLAEMLLAIAGR